MIKTKKELKKWYDEMSRDIGKVRAQALPYYSDRINLSDKQIDLMNDVIFGLKKAQESAVFLSIELSRKVKE